MFTKLRGLPIFGEELPVQREVNNIHDDFSVAVTAILSVMYFNVERYVGGAVY